MTTIAATTDPVALATALDQWRDAIGAEHVLTGAETAEFSDPYRPEGLPGEDPVAVLQPASTEEVQAVVRIANEHSIPLWTGSQGRNNGYGGSAPRTPGTVVLNLRRMDKVLTIDDELCYVVVEPGVSFNQLYDEIRASGKKVWMSTPDLGWGSVVGNTLEHGTGYARYGDHASAMCGVEVVLADGSLVRTGYGAMEGNEIWHLAPFSYGPRTDGLFTQSNMGIVTRMGMWVQPEPEVYADVRVAGASDADLEAIIDGIRPLMLDGTIDNYPSMFNAHAVLGLAASRAEVWPQGGMMPRQASEEIAMAVGGFSPWNLGLALYGPRAVVEQKIEVVRRAFAHVDTITVTETVRDGADVDRTTPGLDQKGHVQAGIPDMTMLEGLRWDGGTGGHMCLGTAAPLTGTDARAVVELIREGSERHGFEYGCMFVINPRHFVHLTLPMFDQERIERVEAAYAMVRELVVTAAEKGYAEYRAHLDQMDLVAEQFGWNGQAHLRMVELIKDALDPKGILAPGKQGIWPARMRGA